MLLPHQPQPISTVRYFFPLFDCARTYGAAVRNAVAAAVCRRKVLRFMRNYSHPDLALASRLRSGERHFLLKNFVAALNLTTYHVCAEKSSPALRAHHHHSDLLPIAKAF